MRKYQAIWEKIKRDKVATLEVHPAHFARVVKAVIKEKCIDFGFKLFNDHDNFWLKIERFPEKHRLVFRLKQTLGLEGVKDGTE